MSLMPIVSPSPPAPPVIGSIDFSLSTSDGVYTTDNISSVGTGDFTWEAWIKLRTYQGNYTSNPIMGVGTTTADWIWIMDYGTDVWIDGKLGGSTLSGAITSMALNTWVHFALVRSSGVLEWFENGTSLGTETNTGNVRNGKALLAINDTTPTRYIDGNIALARWSNIARYTSNFTPATDYGSDANTLALIGSFDGGSTISEASAGMALTLVGSPTASADAP